MPTWSGEQLGIRIAADRLLLGPEGAQVLAAALDRVARVDGLALSAELGALRAVAAEVATQRDCGTAEVRRSVHVPASSQQQDLITAKEAAELMGCTREYIGRLASTGRLGTSRVVAGRRLVSRLAVLGHIAERRSA